MNALQDPRALTIIKEARQHFVADGYAGTRIEPIAREASVSTATLYMLFDSKAALFEAVIRDAATDFDKKLDMLKLGSKPSKEMLTNVLIGNTEFMSDPFVRKMFRLVISERPRFGELAAQFFDQGRGNIAYVLIETFETLNAQGISRIEKPGWAASQLLGMVEHQALLMPLALGRDPVASHTPKAIAEDALETFWARYKA